MNNSQESNNKRAEVLKLIKSHTFGSVVAGGYARDVFFGVEPKDVDVCVYNYHADEAMLLNSLWRELQAYGVVNKSMSEEVPEHYRSAATRISFVWAIPELDMDLIFYKDCRKFSDVLNKFDFNMNQFYLPSTVSDNCFEGEHEYNPELEESPVYFSNDHYDTLIQLKDTDITESRISRMIEKHRQLVPYAWIKEYPVKLIN